MNIVWSSSREPELNESLGNWCAAQIGLPRPFTGHTSMGVFDDSKLIAVMVFHNWYPESGVVEISGAATDRRWLNRKTMWAMFEFPFVKLGCQLVVMRVSEKNVMWNGRGIPRFLKAYGFNAYPIPRLRGRDEGEIIYTLTDDDWAGNGFHRR